MHFKDGTPAGPGDVFQHDDGSVGIILGGQVGSDHCSTPVLMINSAKRNGTIPHSQPFLSFSGTLRSEEGMTLSSHSACVSTAVYMQTKEMTKIGHVDL